MTAPSYDLCVAGGGPAGMMAGFLFARAGAKVVVLEKHADFLRDFRGDTVHPSTLELFYELGMLDRLLARPHDKVSRITGLVAGAAQAIADFRHLPVHAPYIAMMPQWEFLDFLAEAGRGLAGFELRMSTEAIDVVLEGDRIAGVVTASGERLGARLTIAADGRRSILREQAALPLTDIGAPMDVFWFRLPKTRTPENRSTGVFTAGRIVALIDRGDYWQCAWVFGKGLADSVRARGLEAMRGEIVAAAPFLAGTIDTLTNWDQVKLLTVALDRLERWHRPGLLAIGDAAHAMSPVGGVGINLAVQDAVAAANLLAGPLARGEDVDPLLPKVQARRSFPTRATQAVQKLVQQRIIVPTLAGEAATRPPAVFGMFRRFPVLQRLPGRLIGLGVRPERIRSPAAG
jgi:2-polyprenyl-6-methoxyphenol hydroxylase-like FAD-dependent oxidoreductase